MSPGTQRPACEARGSRVSIWLEPLRWVVSTLGFPPGAVLLADIGTASLAAQIALALPMTVRGRHSAFVLVGHKPQQELYRPDEISLLARSVRNVGLDLEALRVEELERDKAEALGESARLRFALQTWHNGPVPPGKGGAQGV